MKRDLKVGDVLIAIDRCKLNHSNEYALKIGKEYKIRALDDYEKCFKIKSESFNVHEFDYSDLDRFFTIKPKKKESGKVADYGHYE